MLLAFNDITEEQRIQRNVVAIMRHSRYRWVTGLLMVGEMTVVDDVETARTNGRDTEFGREFVRSLTDAELRFVILHELYHKMYKHLITWKWMWDKYGMLANVACDYNINGKLVDENREDGFAKMPVYKDGEHEGEMFGCYDERFRDGDDWMDSAAIIRLLLEDRDNNPTPDNGSDGSSTGSEQGNGSGGNNVPDIPQGFDEHDWEGAQAMPEEEQKQLAKDVNEAIQQGALAAGKMGSGGSRVLEELLTPKVDWREMLREFMHETCKGSHFSTWRRPNRRYLSAGAYMPSGVSETVEELVAAIDASMSIDQSAITAFLSEVASLCETLRPNKVRLLYWDTAVCREEIYENDAVDAIRTSTKPAGGGGTDVDCVTRYLADNDIKPQATIVFTDGHVYDWSEWDCPVLWCILDNKHATPDVGSYVHIESNDL